MNSAEKAMRMLPKVQETWVKDERRIQVIPAPKSERYDLISVGYVRMLFSVH